MGGSMGQSYSVRGSTSHSEPNVGYKFTGLSVKSYGGPGFYDRLIQSEKKNDFGIDTVT